MSAKLISGKRNDMRRVMLFALPFSLMVLPSLRATTFVIMEEGVEVGRWVEDDGSDEIKVLGAGSGGEAVTTAARRSEKAYDSLGQLEAIRVYEDDALVEVRRYYPNARLKEETFYQEGELHGPQREYFESGRIKFEAGLEKGVYQGPVRAFDHEGRVIAEGTFRDGELNGKVTVQTPWNSCEIMFADGAIVEYLTSGCGSAVGVLRSRILKTDPDKPVFFAGKDESGGYWIRH